MSETHESVYSGLLVNDEHWAFGTDFEDPLAGVDTTVPQGVDPQVLGTYCLMLGDDALVLSQRLSEWTSRAPDLEEDIALANMALDLLGQARLLLARAAAADPSLVPDLAGSPVPPEDRLAFFRGDMGFKNVRLVEPPDADFADAIVRTVLFSTWRLALFDKLRSSADNVIAAVAAKGVKELAYHRDFAGRWFVTLAHGTDESRARLEAALMRFWPMWDELFATHDVEARAAQAGVGVDPATVRADVDAVLAQLWEAAAMEPREPVPMTGVRGGLTGRDGLHTEHLSRMLAEMQSVAREHPQGLW